MAAFGSISDLSAVCPPLGRGPEADIDYDEPTSAVDPNCRSGDGCGSITYRGARYCEAALRYSLGIREPKTILKLSTLTVSFEPASSAWRGSGRRPDPYSSLILAVLITSALIARSFLRKSAISLGDWAGTMTLIPSIFAFMSTV